MALEQGRFVGTYDPTEQVMLELTVPLQHDQDVFRVGWSLKGLGRTGWIAISTGEYKWTRRNLPEAAGHVLALLQECDRVVTPPPRGDRD